MLADIEDYDWDNLMCNWCRKRKAELLCITDAAEPLCIECADLTVDRLASTAMNPEMAHLLPPLRER